MVVNGRHDAVVIGSGAGGAAAAWRLCEHGLKVLLLEAGPAFVPAIDYPHDQPGWERHPFPERPGSQAELSYGSLGTLDPADEDLAAWSRAGFPWRLPPGSPRPPSARGYVHVLGVGGSTLHFVGEAHRMHPDAFRLATLTRNGADWPIAYADLEPYYAIAEEAQGVAGTGGADGRWRSRPFPQPAHPLGPGALALRAAGRKLGQRWEVNPRHTLSVPRPGRPACNYCGQCARGCPLGDKGSTDVTFLRAALSSGRLELRPSTTVTRLLAGADGRIARLELIHDRQRQTVETPILVLAAGAVQTPRLLLLSADGNLPGGLANSSGQLGRNFMETLWWQSTGLVPGLELSHRGLPDDAICWDAAAPGRVPDMNGGFVLKHATAETGLNGPIAYARRLLPGFGSAFKASLRERFGSAVALEAVGQVIPDERSRISLDAAAHDVHGLPLARIDSVLTTESMRLLRHMAGAVRTLLQAAGAELVEEMGSRDAFSAPHVFGTARMGVDTTRSVVDPELRSHDHPNLWITDASVFPTSGAGESPSLTIMALAIRTADAIAGTVITSPADVPPAS